MSDYNKSHLTNHWSEGGTRSFIARDLPQSALILAPRHLNRWTASWTSNENVDESLTLLIS
ncbi:MAG: hypothetical protein ABI891_13085 [Acidobacteriota bacterium]